MKMQMIAVTLALGLAAAPVAAQDKSKDAMAKDKAPTAAECKDWMAKNKDAKKDDPMKMKCDDMMKKGDAMKGDAMKGDAPKK